ncbi:glycerol-3-phosphate acyltransferase [Secundilactobacillus pentosiphilus]|uniref:Glycerol-3-phosphate acyltransferase n=1 Tax=Secundilactobacillus pentosiphilus TaxID=1714682 RepID=A0A1Z5IM79_9LACO|nr:glycerol-3-phosphate 1-O-acyltransferase PlsY [Secundilactobacillus pentosiphilus]GAX02853.1 glycerol-3-phosphate acyltransferase [Secundilactobacillus pentosiphilus]GAX05849.1 glycerol-3-phosphate acyltransferase [Secundilactobacillus pentosiphilus]
MKLALLLLIAYLLGAIPNGVWIGKGFFHTDIRKAGSGNIGTTNTYRVLGPIAGTAVLILDLAKGTVATLLPVWFLNFHLSQHSPMLLLFGFMAILGHTVSIFDHFKGGKAVATSAGMLLAYNPLLFVIAATCFVSLIYLTSMVSLASMVSFTIITILCFVIQDWYLSALAVCLTIFVFWRHRTNLTRIMNGTENMVSFGLGNKRRQRQNQNRN